MVVRYSISMVILCVSRSVNRLNSYNEITKDIMFSVKKMSNVLSKKFPFVAFMDLINIGYLSMVRGFDTYVVEKSNGANISTWCILLIRNSMVDYIYKEYKNVSQCKGYEFDAFRGRGDLDGLNDIDFNDILWVLRKRLSPMAFELLEEYLKCRDTVFHPQRFFENLTVEYRDIRIYLWREVKTELYDIYSEGQDEK